jgi:hypothetical protein
MIEEKNMGRSRADLVMVLPGEVVGIEIKSDADTYARLERQVKDYDQYYDRNYVVAGTSHAMHIEEHVPPYWGIITVEEVEGAADFYVLREARTNPKRDWIRKLSILWRPELAHIQSLNELPAYKDKSKKFVIQKLIERVPEELLAVQVSEELFERDYQEIAEVMETYRQSRKMASGKTKKKSRRRRRV